MTITVRFFASLRERVGRAETTVAGAGPHTVADIWATATGGQPCPPNTLVAINMEYADRDRIVADGDEVAFFPPVTGG
ncbi:MAG: MoaD/ThiS family protein [Gammaproteobacteria bacterium]|nr:MoaD/ThiS family protein [Gammaproteobacteria bacterium]